MLDFILDEDLETDAVEELEALRLLMEAMLKAACPPGETEYECSLRVVSDATIQELNRTYRGKDSPTDVLAFSQQEGEGVSPKGLLGDIVISLETARRQANKSLGDELEMLGAHGLCHLLGYDHQTDEEEEAMNTRMTVLRNQANRMLVS